MNDKSLVLQVIDGDTEAYVKLARSWAGRIFALCLAHLPRIDLAARFTQEVLVRGLEELPSLADPERFAASLGRIAIRLCNEKMQSLPECSERTPSDLAASMSLQQSDSVLQAVIGLPLELRTVLLVHHVELSTYEDVARLLDTSRTSVNHRLARARGMLLSKTVGVPWSPPQGIELRLELLLSAKLDRELSQTEQDELEELLQEHNSGTYLQAELEKLDQQLSERFSLYRKQIDQLLEQINSQLSTSKVRRCTLLIVDDEELLIPILVQTAREEFEVFTARNAAEAEQILQSRPIDILLTDQRMPGKSGVQLLEWTRENSPQTIRLLMTGYSELEHAIEAINRGHVYYYLVKPWRQADLLQILRNAADKFLLERERERYLEELRQLNRDLERRVAERTSELQEANQLLEQRARELERLALTDPLTGLLNRRAMEQLAKFELKRHARYPSPVAIGYIDVDFFKNINTQFLLTGGDEVLKALARILTASIREVDSLGRVGGEEFLVIARETHREGTAVLAERLRHAVESTSIPIGEANVHITVSLGFAVAEVGVRSDLQEMLDQAASALNAAKAQGRNRWVIAPVTGSKITT